MHEQSTAAPCGFLEFGGGEAEVVPVVHVDDNLVSTHGQVSMEQLVASISENFAPKDLVEASNYLGGDIARNRNEGVLELNQHIYIKFTAECFGVLTTSTIPAVAGGVPL